MCGWKVGIGVGWLVTGFLKERRGQGGPEGAEVTRLIGQLLKT